MISLPVQSASESIFDIESEVRMWPERRDRWLYLAIPDRRTAQLDRVLATTPRGFRSVPVIASIDGEPWVTALFRYQDGSWTLPLKAAVRRRHGVELGALVRVHVTIIEVTGDSAR
jgi:Domain of unknown function (DUF1905)